MAAIGRYPGVRLEFKATTDLQRLIINACDAVNFEPGLSINLDIADAIKDKQGNAPAEAAEMILRMVNSDSRRVSLLALELLSICVRNCGFPFQYQIAAKKNLNSLVRRFPQRPPPRLTEVQKAILALIEEWRVTICQKSALKEDLAHILDMHALLHANGYQFPSLPDNIVYQHSEDLRSAEQMEQEEREARAAKLQELIRRGGQHDLQEANKLIKIIAGYDTNNRTDWRAKAAEEVSKVQQKARLLEEMLQRHERSDEKWDGGDAFEELVNSLISAHPKIQKMCEEESDDHEAVAKLLEINDSIHRTIERYKLMQKGEVVAARKIPKGVLGTSGDGLPDESNRQLSLIDLDDASVPPAVDLVKGQTSTEVPSSLQDDLLGLNLGSSGIQCNGPIFLGTSNPSTNPSLKPSTQHRLTTAEITRLYSNTTTPLPSRHIFQSIPVQSQSTTQTPGPSDLLSKTATPIVTSPKLDPFAEISSLSHAITNYRSLISPIDLSSLASKPPQLPVQTLSLQNQFSPAGNKRNLNSHHIINPTSAAPAHASANPPSTQDDDWNFESALPVPTAKKMTISNTTIKILWELIRPQHTDHISIKSTISNNTQSIITNLRLQVAVAKGKSYRLQLQPQSSVKLGPNHSDSIIQTLELIGVTQGQSQEVRMRWKAEYTLAGNLVEESGSVEGLPIGL